MSLPLDKLAVYSRAIIGRELLVPSDAQTVVPAPETMARLQRLHAAAATLAEDAPEVLCHPDASRGLEQALIEAMVRCRVAGLAAGEVDRVVATPAGRQLLVDRGPQVVGKRQQLERRRARSRRRSRLPSPLPS